MNMTDFWAEIEAQLDQLTRAITVDEVLTICPTQRGLSTGDGFFAGSGGDGTVWDSLWQAGWRTVRMDASYYWCMRSPNGEELTYIEGDLYRGNTMGPES